jgi:protein-disulfide isomerase
MRRVTISVFLVLFAVSLWAQVTSTAAGQKPLPSAPKPEAAEQTPAVQTDPTVDTVEAFMKHMFGYDPNIQWKIITIRPSPAPNVEEVIVGVRNQQQTEEPMQPMQFYVMPDRSWAIAGDLMPFGADPFAPVNKVLSAKAHGYASGGVEGATTIVEFSDLECPACKAAHPTIEKLLADFPNVRFIFQNFPLEQIHPWAFKAATYADCVAHISPDTFWKFIKADYDNQDTVNPQNVDQRMKDFATQAGANADKVAACAADPAAATRVRDSLALGKEVDINSTPTLFINGRRIQNFSGIPYEVLKELVTGTPK